MIEVQQLSPEQWSRLSEKAHLVTFGEEKPKEFDRIDFALLGVRDQETMCGYVTCREMDMDTLYWQFGGSFPGTKETSVSWLCYQAFGAWCKERYKRTFTLVENTNIVMLKMAFKLGYRVVGTRFIKKTNTIYCELLLEFE